MCVTNWITSLYSGKDHNIVNQPYVNKPLKNEKKKKEFWWKHLKFLPQAWVSPRMGRSLRGGVFGFRSSGGRSDWADSSALARLPVAKPGHRGSHWDTWSCQRQLLEVFTPITAICMPAMSNPRARGEQEEGQASLAQSRAGTMQLLREGQEIMTTTRVCQLTLGSTFYS